MCLCVVSTKVHDFNQICNDGESDFCLASSFKSVNDVCHRSRNGIHVSLVLLEIISLSFFFHLWVVYDVVISKICEMIPYCNIIHANDCPNDRFRMMSNRFQLTDPSLCGFFLSQLCVISTETRMQCALCTSSFSICATFKVIEGN